MPRKENIQVYIFTFYTWSEENEGKVKISDKKGTLLVMNMLKYLHDSALNFSLNEGIDICKISSMKVSPIVFENDKKTERKKDYSLNS